MDSELPLVLIILDGFGCSETKDNNAITKAKTTAWHDLQLHCPNTMLSASGLDVGLPPGQMGNSEVGHMTIGSGRVIYQDLSKINLAIADGSFFNNPVLAKAMTKTAANNKALHVLGLLSPGGIHSHTDHIAAIINMAQENKIEKIYLHAFLDGRDTPPKSAMLSIQKFAPYIVSMMGRFYAMDRDKRKERTEAAVNLLLKGTAAYYAQDPIQAINAAYARGETDEFVSPTQIKPVTINEDDTVICMNFRADRMRQICHALIEARPALSKNIITLTEYDKTLPVQVAFAPLAVNDTLPEVLANNGLTQLHIAETEKYAHVTFFFNAGKEQPVIGEERILIPSPKVATYDLAPQMSAEQITAAIITAITHKQYDVIICNYANADMLGHTGNLSATISAIEEIDNCIGKIVTAINSFGGSVLITADHGNAELMWDVEHNQPHTAHTTNLVPLLYVGPKKIKFKNDKTYGLQNIAPTMLELLGIPKPAAMTGESIISTD